MQFRDALINLKILMLSYEQAIGLLFLNSLSRLFVSIVVDRNKFLQKLCLISKRGTASKFLVIYGKILSRIMPYR